MVSTYMKDPSSHFLYVVIAGTVSGFSFVIHIRMNYTTSSNFIGWNYKNGRQFSQKTGWTTEDRLPVTYLLTYSMVQDIT